MTIPEAQQEFKIRYYLWATNEFEQEIEEHFPCLGLFRTGPAWQLLQFIKKLDRESQLRSSRALLHRFHPGAVKALAERCEIEGESLRNGLDYFRHDAASLIQLDISTRRHAGEKIRFIGKRKALNAVARNFQNAFAGLYEESERVLDEDPSLEFQTKCPGGWIISTHFWFGRSETLIDYSHTISSEMTFEQRGPNGLYEGNFLLNSMMSFCSWLGICSQTQWEYLANDKDVNQACNAVIKFCSRFFDTAPKLLKGLEVNSINFE